MRAAKRPADGSPDPNAISVVASEGHVTTREVRDSLTIPIKIF